MNAQVCPDIGHWNGVTNVGIMMKKKELVRSIQKVYQKYQTFLNMHNFLKNQEKKTLSEESQHRHRVGIHLHEQASTLSPLGLLLHEFDHLTGVRAQKEKQ
ncbi:hypothetical protein ACJX0J_020488, partial [Zea mays]